MTPTELKIDRLLEEHGYCYSGGRLWNTLQGFAWPDEFASVTDAAEALAARAGQPGRLQDTEFAAALQQIAH